MYVPSPPLPGKRGDWCKRRKLQSPHMISDRLFTIREEGDSLLILDQTLLPHQYATRHLNSLADAAHKHGQKAFAVHIFPFRMTSANMKRHRASKWADFWQDLKQGFDKFESSKRPPRVTVKGDRYTFTDG